MTGTTPGGRVLVAGSANVDFVVRAPHIPAPGETVLGGDLSVVPGGKGANQAVAAARAGGADTAMLVALGNDPSASVLEESLRAAGVDLHLIRATRPTGAALITVSDGAENAITVAQGANGELAPEHLPLLDGVSWLLLQLETPLATVIAYARAARVAGVGVMLNAAPAQPLPAELLALIDVLVVNEEELAAIVGTQGSIAERIGRTGVATTVVTLGERGCCAVDHGTLISQAAFSIMATDTTAAGDTFCGVLGAALTNGTDLLGALRRAAAAAALSATRSGAQTSIPTAVEVAAFLADAAEADARTLAAYCGISE
jgi:ribokinase